CPAFRGAVASGPHRNPAASCSPRCLLLRRRRAKARSCAIHYLATSEGAGGSGSGRFPAGSTAFPLQRQPGSAHRALGLGRYIREILLPLSSGKRTRHATLATQTVSGDSGSTFSALQSLWPYMWPPDRRDLKLRLIWAT